MKKTNLFLVAWMMLGVAFTACSDDDEDGGKYDGAYTEKTVEAHEYGAWSYFNFETGEVKKLAIKKEEGAVTGLYKGPLKGTGMFATIVSIDEQPMIINRISADSVEIILSDLVMSMPGTSGKPTPFTVKTHSKAIKEGNVWKLTGTATDNIVEDGKGGSIIYKLTIDGTIGTAKGEALALECKLRPGAMPMDITANYSATVANNYVYGVDAAEESALDWDIAIHKYDIRTNSGLVKKMTTTDLDAVNTTNLPAESEMVADTDGSVMADMTNMQLGYVGFQDVKLNKELGGWVTATPTGTMPPYTYTLNDNVFVVKVDGKVWKMKFTAYTYGGKTAAKFYYGEVK